MAIGTVTAGSDGVAGLLKSPKVLLPLILLVVGGAIFLMASARNRTAAPKPREVPICFPTGAAAYTPGIKPLARLGKTDGLAVERQEAATTLLAALDKCTTLFCPGKGLAEYKTKLERYVTQRAAMIRTFDAASGDDGIAYVQQLFETRDDDRIIGDFKQRISAKQIPMDYVFGLPALT